MLEELLQSLLRRPTSTRTGSCPPPSGRPLQAHPENETIRQIKNHCHGQLQICGFYPLKIVLKCCKLN